MDAVDWVKEVIARFPNAHQMKVLHCQNLDHRQRVAAAQVLAEKPFRSLCVSAHKPSLDAAVFTDKNQLYFYLCRYLLERVSWICRDSRRSIKEGDGRVKVVFSRRGKLSYDDFKAYLERLRADPDVTINWGVLDIDGIEARDHSTRAGLQIADIVATCITAGLEPDIFGNCERRYADILRSRIYRRRGNFLSYGFKLVPNAHQIPMNDEQAALIESFEQG